MLLGNLLAQCEKETYFKMSRVLTRNVFQKSLVLDGVKPRYIYIINLCVIKKFILQLH